MNRRGIHTAGERERSTHTQRKRKIFLQQERSTLQEEKEKFLHSRREILHCRREREREREQFIGKQK